MTTCVAASLLAHSLKTRGQARGYTRARGARIIATMTQSNEVRIVAEFRAAAGKAAELKALLTTLIAPTRAEAGCLQYDLHADLNDPAHLFFFERFVDLAAIEFHNGTPYLKALGAKLEGLLAEPPRVTRVSQIG